jgi:hypothetical protein
MPAELGCILFASQDPTIHNSTAPTSLEIDMLNRIKWEYDLDLALSMAKVQEKNVLLDFFNPG